MTSHTTARSYRNQPRTQRMCPECGEMVLIHEQAFDDHNIWRVKGTPYDTGELCPGSGRAYHEQVAA